MMDEYHKSVFLTEIIDLLQIKKGQKYIDATLGGGGHTLEILKRGGLVLGIDLDDEALEYAHKQWEETSRNLDINPENLTLAKGNFKDLAEIARLKKFTNVSGVIYDLGISSHQVDEGERGFSFLKQGPLDMRMDRTNPVKASDLVNILAKGELYDIIFNLGQERRARSISDSIIRARRINPIKTTQDLTEIIQDAYGIRKGEISTFAKANISKRTFQALRMAVNSELDNLNETLPQSLEILEKGGRILAITFHSLEDRIVKFAFKDFQERNLGRIITKKPLMPTEKEMSENSRSRSAKLRVFEKK
ncbi:16S rRNA (cytosine(1402)-N(4))-methyltransferase RsmH [Patescibacteria group bacterium]|nr:16S rRNA (cytosine(1402)-N(4))-methyltransferase RsmH [Patescibacteria group bacterium]